MHRDEGVDAVDVLVELPPETGLADAGGAVDGDQSRPSLLRGGMEQLLDQPELTVAAAERRFQSVDPPCTANCGYDLPRLEQALRLGLPLELVHAPVVVQDRGGGQLARLLVDPNVTGCSTRLHP